MDFEQPDKTVESALKRNNHLQLELVERFYGFPPQNEQLQDWIEKNATLFSELVREKPELLATYETDHEATLIALEEELYHEHPHHEEIKGKHF